MKKLLEMISEEMQAAFEAAGYGEAEAGSQLGRVTLSNRPDLCEYQCNGAMAGAKKFRKAPIMIAGQVAEKLEEAELLEMTKAYRRRLDALFPPAAQLRPAKPVQQTEEDRAFLV